MYLGLHFPSSGSEEGVNPVLAHSNSPDHALRFPQRVAKLLVSLTPKRTNDRALDVGCAVGGSSFKLAKTFNRVDAFDYSCSFIDAAKQMQLGEGISFWILVEADIYERVRAVHEPGKGYTSFKVVRVSSKNTRWRTDFTRTTE